MVGTLLHSSEDAYQHHATQVRLPGFINFMDKNLWRQALSLRGLAPGPHVDHVTMKLHGQNFILGCVQLRVGAA